MERGRKKEDMEFEELDYDISGFCRLTEKNRLGSLMAYCSSESQQRRSCRDCRLGRRK